MKISIAIASLAFGMAFLEPQLVKAEAVGAWDYNILSSKMNDEKFPTARLRADDGAILSVQCQGYISTQTKRPVTWFRVTVYHPEFLGQTEDLTKRKALHRFDNATAEENPWSYDDNSAQLSADQNKISSFLSSLAVSKRLIFELRDYRYQKHYAEFRLDPAEGEKIKTKITQDCTKVAAESRS